MSLVTKPPMLDKTGKDILEEMKTLNTLMGIQVGTTVGQVSDLEHIRNYVRSGKADKVFNIGDQIIVPWTDILTGKTYDCPFNICHFGEVELEDGEKVPGMFIQMNYASLYPVMFDAFEAAYVAAQELPAGTYNMTIVSTWSKAEAGTYQFTLTHPVPEGGHICIPQRIADVEISTWKVSTYSSGLSTTPIETVPMTAGNGGTSLGELVLAGNANLNSIQRAAYGYGRWSQSAYRQYMNSAAGIGEWWTPQNPYDRAPDQLATRPGLLSGFGDDFLDIIRPVKVATALNTVTDGNVSENGIEYTFDRFFLPSLEQIYTEPQLAGAEGEAWLYWKRALGLSAPSKHHPNVYDAYKTFAIENHNSAQYVRLRSAFRGSAYYAWYQSSDGYVGIYSACIAYRGAGACVIS